MIQNAEIVVREVVAGWRPEVKILKISALTPDASLRRYFRILFTADAKSSETAVAMVFDSIASPEAGGAQEITSDEAYVRLTEFFRGASVAVPQLYFDSRERGILIIEDVGDLLLASTLSPAAVPTYSDTEIESLYLAAIDQIFRIQRIPVRTDFFAFQRSFQGPTYIREMEELRDYSLESVSLTELETKLLNQLFSDLATRLIQMPQVLCHRDYHPWNLMVWNSGIRIIDFQDALMATPCYDVVALLNDRDGDAMLGVKRYNRLVRAFAEELGGWNEQFAVAFALVLLQRDLKVAGRFAKLVALRNLQQYAGWIPGTQRRIGRTLRFLISSNSISGLYRESFSLLNQYLPEISADTRELFQEVS